MEINQTEEMREKQILCNENRHRELNDSTKHNIVHIIGTPEGEEIRGRGAENIFEVIIAENS